MFPQSSEHLNPVETQQHHIENDQIDAVRARTEESSLASLRQYHRLSPDFKSPSAGHDLLSARLPLPGFVLQADVIEANVMGFEIV